MANVGLAVLVNYRNRRWWSGGSKSRSPNPFSRLSLDNSNGRTSNNEDNEVRTARPAKILLSTLVSIYLVIVCDNAGSD